MKPASFFATLLCSLTLLCTTPALRAAEGEKPAEKKSCCEATTEAGKKCAHKCCVDAADAGKVCEKCHKKG